MHGKRDNQKLKPYIVLQILQRETLGSFYVYVFIQGDARKILEICGTFCGTGDRETPENAVFSGVLSNRLKLLLPPETNHHIRKDHD